MSFFGIKKPKRDLALMKILAAKSALWV